MGGGDKKSSGCRQNGSVHQWGPSGKETTEGPTTSLLSHVSGESECEMGEGCGEGKEGLAWEVGKDQEGKSRIKYISIKESGTVVSPVAFHCKVTPR